MSFTYNGSISGGAASLTNTVTVTLGFTPSVGDLLLAFPGVANGAGGASISDSKSNTWTPVFGSFQHDSGSDFFANIYYSILSSVGASMTVTFSCTSNNPISVCASGYTPSATVSTDGNGVGSSATAGTSFSTSAITTTGSSDLVVGFTASRSSGGFAAGGSFTLIQSVGFASGKAAGIGIEHQLGVAAGSITPTMTGNSGQWVMVGAAFTVAGGVTFQPWIFGDQIQDMQG